MEGLQTTIFRVPGKFTKNGKDHEIVLNRTARSVIEQCRGEHEEFVFSYQGHGLSSLNGRAWEKTWLQAGLPTDKDHTKGPHNLRHTFATRLRDVEVPEWSIKDLMHHVPCDVTRRYSAPELKRLLEYVRRLDQPVRLEARTATNLPQGIQRSG